MYAHIAVVAFFAALLSRSLLHVYRVLLVDELLAMTTDQTELWGENLIDSSRMDRHGIMFFQHGLLYCDRMDFDLLLEADNVKRLLIVNVLSKLITSIMALQRC